MQKQRGSRKAVMWLGSIGLCLAMVSLATCQFKSRWRAGQEGEPKRYLSVSPREFRDYCEERVRRGVNTVQSFGYVGSTDDRHFFEYWEAGLLWDSSHYVGVARSAALDRWIGEPKAFGPVRNSGSVIREGEGAKMRLLLWFEPDGKRILHGSDLVKPEADASGR